jgi:hypothetical protein
MPLTKHHMVGVFGLVPFLLQAAPPPDHLDDIQKALGVPTSIAEVTDGQWTSAAKLPEIILVQDIHRHPEVQGHIAALLLYGVRHWDLKHVYLEGAEAQTPLSLPAMRDTDSLRDALQEGRLSGAEVAVAMEPDSAIALHGLEDLSVYRQNVLAYEQVERLREPAFQELDTANLLESTLDMEVGSPQGTQASLLRRMLQLRLKPADYTAYKAGPYAAHEGSSLYEAVRAAEAFYTLADQRSQIFLKNLDAGATESPRLVIVGGYHTASMAAELRRQGRSFAVLTPKVTQSGFDDLYARGMQETISALKLD